MRETCRGLSRSICTGLVQLYQTTAATSGHVRAGMAGAAAAAAAAVMSATAANIVYLLLLLLKLKYNFCNSNNNA